MAGAGVRDILFDGPWVHRDLAANGIRVHLVVGEQFSPARPLVVLLHGFGEFWWAWRHQIPLLDQAGYSVAAMDLRGYGATDKTPRGYDPHTTAYDVSGVIRSLGFSRATLVGHDWGGMAAWATAAYAPEVLHAMVTVAAPHPLAFPWRANLRRLAFFQLPWLPERRIMADDGKYVEDLLRSQAADGAGLLTSDEARHYRDALMLWPSPHCAMEYQRMFVRDQVRSGGRDYRRALRRGSRFRCCRSMARPTRCCRRAGSPRSRAGSTARTRSSACRVSAISRTRSRPQCCPPPFSDGWTAPSAPKAVAAGHSADSRLRPGQIPG